MYSQHCLHGSSLFFHIAAWRLHEMNSECHVISPGSTKQKEVVVRKGRGVFVMQIKALAFIQAETFLAQSSFFLQLFFSY